MSKPRGRSVNRPLPKDLVTLQNVQIHELLESPFGLRYFELEYNGERLRIRVHDRPDIIEAIETHLNMSLDVTIFPYRWMIGEKSGTINYYYNAKLHKQGE